MEDKENTLKSVPNVSSNETRNTDYNLKSAGSDGEMDSYVCKICDFNLSSSDALNNHLHSLHAVRRTKDSFSCGCHTCSEIFPTSSLLIDHLRSEHTVQKFHSCSRCEKKLDRSYSVPTHCSSDPPSKIYCMLCITELQNTKDKVVKFIKVKNKKKNTLKSTSLNITPTNSSNVDPSLISASEGETDSYMCQICELDLSSSDALDNHFQSLHVVFCCGSCKEEFKTLEMLMNHLRHSHTALKINFCSQCGQKLASGRSVPINSDSNDLPKNYCAGCATEHQNESSRVVKVVNEKRVEENSRGSISDGPANMISFNDDADEFNNASSDEETDSYFCQVCQQDLSSSSDVLNKHLRSSHVIENGGGCFSCGLCKKVFQFNYATVNHLRRYHTLRKIHSCSQCGKKLAACRSVPNSDRRKKPLQIFCSVCIAERKKAKKEASLKQRKPYTRRNERKYVCAICSRKYCTETALLDHQRNPCCKDRYRCEVCDKTSATARGWKRHLMTHSGDKYACEVCDKTFSAQHTLEKHLRTHSGEKPYLCETCGKGFSQPRSLRYHQLLHTGERSYECETCGKTFAIKQYLKNHQLTHTDERPYVCDTCGKGFKVKEVLKKHLLYHSGVKNYACDFCGRRFFRPDFMRQHRRLHTEENPFGCTICGKKFKSSSGLWLHRRRHDGKMFTCDICPKAYWNKNALFNHKFTHGGVKPYSCDFCGKGFALKTAYRQHMITHSVEKPYVCDACGKGFNQKRNLKYHLRIHTGEKPFECDICGRSFAHSYILVAHRRIHTGERPFRCDVCQKGFIDKGQLNKHRATHDRD